MSVPFAEVIGDPIRQSKSPLIHKFWLEKLGIAGDYRQHHVKSGEVEAYLNSARQDPDWRGCNVTLPHKLEVMEHVADPGGVRDTIGAMNTILRQDNGSLMGTNTDAAGFFAPINELDWTGQHVVVIGAGGAARAVLFALKQAGIKQVTILARNGLKASGLLINFGMKGEVLPLDAQLPKAALLVNASPLGMAGKDPLKIDLSPLPSGALVYDLVYSPLETKLLKAARGRGLEVVDGLDMLIGQAALAFELFFGKAPPTDHDEKLRKLLIQ